MGDREEISQFFRFRSGLDGLVNQTTVVDTAFHSGNFSVPRGIIGEGHAVDPDPVFAERNAQFFAEPAFLQTHGGFAGQNKGSAEHGFAVFLDSLGAYINQFLSYEEIDELFPSERDGTPSGTAYYFKDKDGEIFIAIDLDEFGANASGIRLFRDYSRGMEEIEY